MCRSYVGDIGRLLRAGWRLARSPLLKRGVEFWRSFGSAWMDISLLRHIEEVGYSGWLHLSVLQRDIQFREQILEWVEHFLCCFSLAGVLVRPHLAHSLKISQLYTTALYLLVVVVVVVGFGADL